MTKNVTSWWRERPALSNVSSLKRLQKRTNVGKMGEMYVFFYCTKNKGITDY